MLKFVYGHKCHFSDVRVLSNGDLTETHSCGYPEIEKKIVQRRGGDFRMPEMVIAQAIFAAILQYKFMKF